MYRNVIKRALDFSISLVAIIVLSPLLIVVSGMVLILLGKPVLFIQKRVGKSNKPFNMFKFRSMTEKKDEKGNLLPDNQRLTRFGMFLRKTSIDELPALINILKGEMSLIGPRPLPVVYYPYYTDNELHRHDVRGGLTGLAQISGRNALTWEEKFHFDLVYVNNVSFRLDLVIFLKTIYKVFKKSDVLVRRADGKGDLDAQRLPQRGTLE